MTYSEIFIFIMELIGTIAFASSGAMLAIQKQMDIFGVCVLGVTTAVGGGLIRDLILGITPPGMFQKPIYTLVALGVTILLFAIIYLKKDYFDEKIAPVHEHIMVVFDAIGLGIFSVVGVNTARMTGYASTFLLVFVGVLTGVGGGLLRDIMAQEKPYILTRHVYACASILGAFICVFTFPFFGNLGSMLTGTTSIILIRFLAAHYRWNLPRITS